MSIPEKVSNKLSLETNNTLALVTDPYHDYNLKAVGYPDGTSTISAIKHYTTRGTIRCPFMLEPGDSWFFHAFTTPLHSVISPTYASLDGIKIRFSAAADARNMGPLNVWYFLVRDGSIARTVRTAYGNPVSTTDVRTTQKRTVSLGFEIHNITASLYKQGSLTTYRVPSNQCPADLFNVGLNETSPEIGWYHTNLLASLPKDIEAANLLPNSRTWEASAGVYSVSLPHPNNSYSSVLGQNFLIKVDGYYGLQPTPEISGSEEYRVTWSPLATTGTFSSMFTDDNQTFSIDMRQVLELAPAPDDSNTLQFATTAPDYDKVFLKMYKAMYNEIPPGVPVNMNASGDWFRRIVAIAKDYVPLVLSAVGHPAAKASAPAAAAILNAIDSKLNAKVATAVSSTVQNISPHILPPPYAASSNARSVGAASLLSAATKQKIKRALNNTRTAAPAGKTRKQRINKDQRFRPSRQQ